ncbi:glycosyl transferase [Tritrichomonas foetus]|uniref:Beta-1,4-mannosyltransferase n=1 Tax=Tritrichomonas foetus TaxID=1144522 RepID=A0A1J4J5U1_9EUKA|nr:glycosyl transferase [Tritrichomonas foetus]|eukprot:OHS94600.1 glycosyl transferase [Tritrichomonas foetus]
MPNYVVVVLGDIGRSPRMQNHSVCLSKLPDANVHIVGYHESPLFKELQDAKNVHIYKIHPFFDLPRYLFPIYAPLKIFWLMLQLFTLFFRLPKFDLILAQNPPSMPTVPFCWLINLVKGKRFVIDWHNLGFSLLKVHKTSKTIVKIAQFFEFLFGRKATAHITVTKALQEYLRYHKIESVVVYDRPSDLFKPCPEERERFAKELNINANDYWLISSTSWTPDEKIGILLDAAEHLDNDLSNSDRCLSIIITGKGPDQRAFASEVKGRNFKNISFYFEFLKYEDYAKLLGACDIGVSLHISSSGVDLPMKGLDMIGAGLPLLSVDYQCIQELVDDQINGLLFNDGKELAELLKKMFITKDISIAKLKEGSVQSSKKKWDDIWNECAKDVFLGTK